MFTLTIKGLWAHKLRYALTGLAIILGVAFMAGTMVLTDTMEKTFNGVIQQANDGTDVIVRSAGAIDGEFEDVRERVDASLIESVAGVDGVAAAHGSIQGTAQLVRADGTVADGNGFGITIGTNWIDDEQLNPLTLATGHAPTSATDIVLDQRTVNDEGWVLGSDVTILTNIGPTTLTLVGTATYGTVEGLPGTTMLAVNDETAQRLFAEPGKYDLVAVAAAPGVTPTELSGRIETALADSSTGPGLEIITGQQDTVDKQAQLKDDLGFFNDFLMAFAWVALFVGTFIIYNTFSIVVAQRTKDLAMLRAVGAGRGQVLRSVVLESFVVGILSAAIGLIAGIGMSFGLRALLSGVGLDIPNGDIVVSSATITTAFVVGLTVSILSALVPAVKAGRVRPIAALRDVAVDRSGVSVGRVVSGLAITGIGTASFAAGAAASGDSALPLIGFGAATVIVGVFTLGPVLIRPAIRVLGAPLARLSGVTGRYARENAHRTPKRTTATASALMIGVALVGFITILAASTKTSVASAVDKSFRADFVIDAGDGTNGFATSIEDDLTGSGVVEQYSPLRTAVVEIDGSATRITAVDTTNFDRFYDLEVSEGSLANVGTDGIAVSTTKADEDGLALGDTVPLRFADGTDAQLTVSAIFEHTIDGADSTWIVGLDTFEAHVADQFDEQLFVLAGDGFSAADARAAIDQALIGWPNADIQDQAEFKESITSEIDTMLNLIYGLLALAVIIALIGVANTMALSIHERTRELGLLRAIGMHRRQLRTAVRWESVLIAVLGAVAGAILAVAAAWGIVNALDSQGVTELTLPFTQLAVIMVLAGAAGVVAATGPARRAARLNILAAISTE